MYAVLRQMMVLISAAAVLAGAAGILHPRRPLWAGPPAHLGTGEVDVATAIAWGSRAIWIDARPAADFERSHVPGAIRLNENDWEQLLPPVLEAWAPDRRVVVYCGNTQCGLSSAVAKRLRREMQWDNVWVLYGGWEAWQEARR